MARVFYKFWYAGLYCPNCGIKEKKQHIVTKYRNRRRYNNRYGHFVGDHIGSGAGNYGIFDLIVYFCYSGIKLAH